jgi:hypothetical protein
VGGGAKKNPGLLAGSLYVDFICSIFDSQQKHSRLHSKIKEAKIKPTVCFELCHYRSNITELVHKTSVSIKKEKVWYSPAFARGLLLVKRKKPLQEWNGR